MKAFAPQLTQLPDRKVLCVTSIGDPNVIMEPYMKALYGAAYYAKMKVYKPKGMVIPIGKLSAFWPDAHLKPKDQWTAHWFVVVPDYVTDADIIQKDPDIRVKLTTLTGGAAAEILHLGPYSEEGPTITKLHHFIQEQGYDIVDDHEEEYLTMPDVKNQKTVIRYRVKGISSSSFHN